MSPRNNRRRSGGEPLRPATAGERVSTSDIAGAGRQAERSRPESSGLPKRVLVVEDKEEIAETLRRLLTAFGHEVEVARDGIEALAKLKLGVDLVSLDAEMPGMDGFEVARRIRKDLEFGDVPIIMVTGLGKMEDRLRAVEAGINDFIGQPVEMTELRREARVYRCNDRLNPPRLFLGCRAPSSSAPLHAAAA